MYLNKIIHFIIVSQIKIERTLGNHAEVLLVKAANMLGPSCPLKYDQMIRAFKRTQYQKLVFLIQNQQELLGW